MTDRDRDVATALAYLSALGGDDPAAVVAMVSDDFRNEHHAELGSGCVGRDEYARRIPGFFEAFANRDYHVVETAIGTLVDDHVDDADVGHDAAGGARRDVESEVIVRYRFGADVDGIRIDIPGVMWISVRDGRVARRLDCWDSLTFHRQTGTVPTS